LHGKQSGVRLGRRLFFYNFLSIYNFLSKRDLPITQSFVSPILPERSRYKRRQSYHPLYANCTRMTRAGEGGTANPIPAPARDHRRGIGQGRHWRTAL
jgi:hypothetical protein